jgi:hypothetical protein
MKAIIAVPENENGEGLCPCCIFNRICDQSCPDWDGIEFNNCQQEPIIYKIIELEDNKEK